MKDLVSRLKASRLWSKQVHFDILVTKWADLFPEDVCTMLDKFDKLYQTPTDYRSWLNGK